MEEYARGGATLRGLSRKYGIPLATLQRLVKAHERGEEVAAWKRGSLEEDSPRDVKRLERELREARLEAKLYRTMVEVAEKELGIPIRKKSGAK